MVEGGAPPDEGLPSVFGEYDQGWTEIAEDEDGDEIEISHEGGEHDDRARATFEHIVQPRYAQLRGLDPGLTYVYARIPSSRARSERIHLRRARLLAAYASWNEQMPALVVAYLEWKHKAPEAQEHPVGTSFEVTAIHTFCEYAHSIPPAFLTAYKLFQARSRLTNVHQNPDELANVSLIRCGLLGSSPETPAIAISLDTLELYHRLRRHQGQLSVQAMAHTLCDLHGVNYALSSISSLTDELASTLIIPNIASSSLSHLTHTWIY